MCYICVMYFGVLILGLLLRKIYDYCYQFVTTVPDYSSMGGTKPVFTKNKDISLYQTTILPHKKKHPILQSIIILSYFIPGVQIGVLTIEFTVFVLNTGDALTSSN